MIGEYVNTSTKTLFRCSFGHEWSALPRDVMGRNGCPYCGGKVPLTKDMVNDRLLKNGSNIVLVDDHVRRHTKALFRCQNNHEWMATPGNVLCGYGCPVCATHGFNPNKSAVIYLLDFGTYVKYGITNDIKRRLSSHKRSGQYKIIMTVECSGQEAIKWEKMIKSKFGGHFVNKSIMVNGHTETLSPVYTQQILETMRK